MRASFKVILLFSSILSSIVILTLVRLILYFHPQARKRVVPYIMHIFGKIFVLIMGIKIEISGSKGKLKKRGVFFVSNHLSYLEGIAVLSLSPLSFIAKADLRKWPFFGTFAFLSDTIFVNRDNPFQIQKEIGKIVASLTRRVNVILFPEGTSTDGRSLLPFKSPFFAAPLKAKSEVVLLVINYKRINFRKISNENKDSIYWYGRMPFFSHLINVLKLRSIVLEVKVCDSLQAFNLDTANSSSGRKHLSSACWRIIEDNLNLSKAG